VLNHNKNDSLWRSIRTGAVATKYFAILSEEPTLTHSKRFMNVVQPTVLLIFSDSRKLFLTHNVTKQHSYWLTMTDDIFCEQHSSIAIGQATPTMPSCHYQELLRMREKWEKGKVGGAKLLYGGKVESTTPKNLNYIN
jgi:hypothetical protein